MLRMALADVGVPEDEIVSYTGHCLRRGFGTDAADVAMPPDDVSMIVDVEDGAAWITGYNHQSVVHQARTGRLLPFR